jgi:hypothetical protein
LQSIHENKWNKIKAESDILKGFDAQAIADRWRRLLKTSSASKHDGSSSVQTSPLPSLPSTSSSSSSSSTSSSSSSCPASVSNDTIAPVLQAETISGRGIWTLVDDKKIRDWVLKFGTKSWKQLAEQQLQQRSGKQIFERWNNQLAPGIKTSEWSEEEDKEVIRLQSEIGYSFTKMAKTSNILKGRTRLAISNRWNSKLSVRVLLDRQENDAGSGGSGGEVEGGEGK